MYRWRYHFYFWLYKNGPNNPDLNFPLKLLYYYNRRTFGFPSFMFFLRSVYSIQPLHFFDQFSVFRVKVVQNLVIFFHVIRFLRSNKAKWDVSLYRKQIYLLTVSVNLFLLAFFCTWVLLIKLYKTVLV